MCQLVGQLSDFISCVFADTELILHENFICPRRYTTCSCTYKTSTNGNRGTMRLLTLALLLLPSVASAESFWNPSFLATQSCDAIQDKSEVSHCNDLADKYIKTHKASADVNQERIYDLKMIETVCHSLSPASGAAAAVDCIEGANFFHINRDLQYFVYPNDRATYSDLSGVAITGIPGPDGPIWKNFFAIDGAKTYVYDKEKIEEAELGLIKSMETRAASSKSTDTKVADPKELTGEPAYTRDQPLE